MPAKYYLTTPLYYVNSTPHIGHSYTNIAADALARFKRMELGPKNVLFLTGTDEHGQKISKAAQAAGLSPAEFTNKISDTFKALWKTLNIEYDDFIRTTEPRHIEAVQAVWRKLCDKEEIYKAAYVGFYCTPCETFWTDRQVVIENGKEICPDCKRPVDKLEEENYFLNISKHQDWLIDVIKSDKIKVLPQTRKNEVLGFLENNKLQDLCISRPKSRLEWGIPSPISENHVTYVWFDALINYISACGYASNIEKFHKWWPADVHIVGKDILRQHAVYWPLILKSLHDDLYAVALPKMIFAHGWWVEGGEKMSKSRGNAVSPEEIVKTYGVDAYRFFLLREVPFGQDGTFSEEALIERFNRDLANDLGNLLHRSLTMCEKYFDGKIPAQISLACKSELRTGVDELLSKIQSHMNKLAFSDALSEIWALINQSNKFIEDKAPWKLAKEGKQDELKIVIVSLLEVLRMTAQSVWPFMPTIAENIWKQLGIHEKITHPETFKQKWGFFEQGGKIAKGEPLFPRIEVKK